MLLELSIAAVSLILIICRLSNSFAELQNCLDLAKGFCYNDPLSNSRLGQLPATLSMKDYCAATGTLKLNFEIKRSCDKACVGSVHLSVEEKGIVKDRCEKRGPYTYPGDDKKKGKRRFFGFVPEAGPLVLSATSYQETTCSGNETGYHQQSVELVDGPMIEKLEIVRASTGILIQELTGSPTLESSILGDPSLGGVSVRAVVKDGDIFQNCISAP